MDITKNEQMTWNPIKWSYEPEPKSINSVIYGLQYDSINGLWVSMEAPSIPKFVGSNIGTHKKEKTE